MSGKLCLSSDINNFMVLKHAFCRDISAVILSYYMTATDVTGIKHIDILPTDIPKYTQNQLGKQGCYRDFHISAYSEVKVWVCTFCLNNRNRGNATEIF